MDSAPFPPRPFDLHEVSTYDLASRPSKVFREDLGRPRRQVVGAQVVQVEGARGERH